MSKKLKKLYPYPVNSTAYICKKVLFLFQKINISWPGLHFIFFVKVLFFKYPLIPRGRKEFPQRSEATDINVIAFTPDSSIIAFGFNSGNIYMTVEKENIYFICIYVYYPLVFNTQFKNNTDICFL
jgi:hypothetical protein